MKYHTTTTLEEIRACSPCQDGWKELLLHLGKTSADDDPLELLTILESNGFDDALWCLQVPSLERLSRHFQAWCADQVLPFFEREFPDDNRVRAQIEMLRNDNATDGERAAARAASEAASEATWTAARAAARAAARTAARTAAWEAASEAAWTAASEAARAAASEAAWEAASEATWTAASDAQEKQLRAMIGGAK